MQMLPLAIQSGLPLIMVRTDDLINVEEILTHIAGEQVTPFSLPASISSSADINLPKGRVLYTSAECKSLARLYKLCVDKEKTIIFVNVEKSVLFFDAGTLLPPQELVFKFLSEISDEPEELLPSFGGMTLKDISEVAKLTMTRDNSLTPRGVSETRRGYSTLRGITQVDTDLTYYVPPSNLDTWLEGNTKMFTHPVHPLLIPRGLLFTGNPGTGKTLASKHIADRFGVPLYHMDLGAMLGKYVGDSENSLNAALAQIDQVEPCVVLLDEVEKIFQTSNDSGVTSRLLSQLLWWLQEHKTKVFTVMTSNSLVKIPEELFREGRIDSVITFLGVEGASLGYEFAKGAMESMLKKVDAKLQAPQLASALTDLNKRVKTLYLDGQPVPQAKLTQAAYTLVREILSKEG